MCYSIKQNQTRTWLFHQNCNLYIATLSLLINSNKMLTYNNYIFNYQPTNFIQTVLYANVVISLITERAKT